jgi:endoglucanase
MQNYKYSTNRNILSLTVIVLLLIVGAAAVHATVADSVRSTAVSTVAKRSDGGVIAPSTPTTHAQSSAQGGLSAAPSPSETSLQHYPASVTKPPVNPPSDRGIATSNTSAITTATNPLYGLQFYNDTLSDTASSTVAAWNTTRPADAAQINKIASTPRALWLGDWLGDVQATTNATVSAATSQSKIAMLVAYNIPSRDCGSYSAGGATSEAGYLKWITAMANGIAGRRTIVVLEPDALGLITCLSTSEQDARYRMLSQATDLLSAQGALVYIDASTWVKADEMANRLTRAGITHAQGFSLNVSGFQKTSDITSYANQLSSLVGGKHYIIDTSRNGLGASGDWCNPAGRALGVKPQAYSTGLLDAALWIKSPGESDGTCNGGPTAGTWWPDYALGLAERS